GAQDALLGGGRYDDLVELLGGPPTPGVGFAGGMERLVLVLSQHGLSQDEASELDLFVIPIGEEGKRRAVGILAQLRRRGISADLDYMGRSLRKAMSVAARRARYALLLGPDELSQNSATLKNLVTGVSSTAPLAEFLSNPRSFLGSTGT
ncbi:MAG: His/Gly/Thr/Pro-type tRNA ligase C-terminal domain-containing protein, partial [Candidatus Bipolaricaulaceae bacterium]